MWTKQHRKTYKRSDERYPSDLTDAEWAHLEPLIRKRSSFPTLSGCGGEAEDVNRFDEIGSHIWLTI